MSYIQAEATDACEQWLRELPPLHLFGGCREEDAETLWRSSYDAIAYPHSPRLHTVKDMQKHVLDLLDDEADYLNLGEFGLIHRLLTQSGHTLIMNHSEFYACASLVRRLWCYVTFPADGSVALHMPDEVLYPLYAAVNTPSFAEHALNVGEFLQTMDAMLLWKGLMPMDTALKGAEAFFGISCVQTDVFRRFFLSAIDYTWYRGSLILMHPGIYDPRPLFPILDDYPDDVFTSDHELALEEWDALAPLSMAVQGLCTPFMRKDYSPQALSADLSILAKQGCPMEGLVETLASEIITSPTPSMISAVQMMADSIQPWPYYPHSGRASAWL